MTNHKTRWVLSVALAPFMGGCYSGVDANGGAPALADEGGAEGPPQRDPEDDAEEEGGSPNEPEPDPPFELPADEVELLPFHVRLANLERVTGLTQDHFAYSEVLRQRQMLGDHDYAAGIAPDLHWS